MLFWLDISASYLARLYRLTLVCLFVIPLEAPVNLALPWTIMQSLLRSARLPARNLRSIHPVNSCLQNYASESYGSSQSGQDEVNKNTPNPKADLEHPGPKAPADKETAPSGEPEGSSSHSGPTSTSGGRPAIHQPGPPPENKNAEVEAHNKDMEKRNDRTANQLYDKDNKVDKKF